MSNLFDQRVARLRGRLQAEEPGARGLERVARNPQCTRLRALTIIGITPATAAGQVYGEPTREGQSPFAITLGNRFERTLTEHGAAALLDLYRNAGRLGTSECKIAVIPDFAPSPKSMAQRRSETDRLFRLKLNNDAKAPNLIIKPRISVGLLGISHDVEPDALVAADAEVFYKPAEVKSYPDRAGKTETADIRSACRQAGVGVVAMRHALARLGIRNPDLMVPAEGDLVLRAPGSLKPTLRPMTLQSEVASLERAIEEAPRNLDELEAILGPGATLDDPETLESIPNSYRPSCREHCALAAHCKNAAAVAAEPVLLGDFAREKLAPAGTISRALDLLRGSGAPPRTPGEAALAEQLREAFDEYRRAC